MRALLPPRSLLAWAQCSRKLFCREALHRGTPHAQSVWPPYRTILPIRCTHAFVKIFSISFVTVCLCAAEDACGEQREEQRHSAVHRFLGGVWARRRTRAQSIMQPATSPSCPTEHARLRLVASTHPPYVPVQPPDQVSRSKVHVGWSASGSQAVSHESAVTGSADRSNRIGASRPRPSRPRPRRGRRNIRLVQVRTSNSSAHTGPQATSQARGCEKK